MKPLNSSVLLTAAELVDLTGARLPTKQIEVLAANRVPYFLTAGGRPVTTWEAVNHALCGVPGVGAGWQRTKKR